MTPQHHLPADIERTSLSIITAELDAMGLTPPPETAAVVKRVIHTTADFDYARNLRFTPGAVAAGVAALQAVAPIVTDTNMALSGITKPGLARLGAQRCATWQTWRWLRWQKPTALPGRWRPCKKPPPSTPVPSLRWATHQGAADHCRPDRNRWAAPCAGHRSAGGLCERGGKQGAAV